jgi:uncharacterized membrane protein
MTYCANCGAPVEGRFCAKCGASVGAATPPPAPPPPAQPQATAAMNDNVASALCYVLGFITGVLFLLLEPYNRNRAVRFHAFQSIFLSGAMFILWIAMRIFVALVGALVGWWIAGTILFFFGIACLALWILMVVTTIQGRTPPIPVIGPLAQQQA